MRFGLGSVRTRKHVLNSFKLRIETFTLSSPSSTWIFNVKICGTLHKRRFTSIWKIELGSRNLRAMSIRRLHVSYKPGKYQQHKERIKDERRDLHQYNDPVSCVVELGVAVDQTHLQTEVASLISFLLPSPCASEVQIRDGHQQSLQPLKPELNKCTTCNTCPEPHNVQQGVSDAL